MKKLNTLLLIFFIATIPQLKAQSLEDYISKYTAENGEKYMQPFADSFSANLNSGLFHNSAIKKWGFQMYIGVVAQTAIIPTKAKYFNATASDPASGIETQVEAPTVFGPTDGPIVTNPDNGLSYVLPGGFDIDYMPLAMPQLTIGAIFGTDLTLRYINFDVEDVGKVDVFGWGVRHSINNYIENLPVDIAIGYYNQYFKVGEYLNASSNIVNAQCSYNIPLVTLYGALAYETGKVNMKYTYSGIEPEDTNTFSEPGDQVEFDMKAANNIRATVGLTFNLGPVKINGDYNFAKQNTFNVGIGIGIEERDRFRKSKDI